MTTFCAVMTLPLLTSPNPDNLRFVGRDVPSAASPFRSIATVAAIPAPQHKAIRPERNNVFFMVVRCSFLLGPTYLTNHIIYKIFVISFFSKGEQIVLTNFENYVYTYTMFDSFFEIVNIPPYNENGKTIYPFIVNFNGKELINERYQSIEEYEEGKLKFNFIKNKFLEDVRSQFNKNICQ